ncbi:hypothetical protein CVT24_003456 [Panaeolus cyanescens]|uniref:G-protein coupled receptors family 1 profile domain-containing protein n=1 Tax=Panaeolus cyanescens TaxID=181874 RepID=A0A409Y707_9AGAR|nr:hypothetical protein CVT24_003456 [Panaeolus cyanescens]
MSASIVPTFIPIPDDSFGGAIAVNVFALLSTLALVSVAIRIIYLAIQMAFGENRAQPQEYVFFNTQLGQYAACLLVAMIFNTAAGVIGFPWLFQRGITEGNVCRIQALIMQIGNVAAGYFTATIAVHTFSSLAMRKRQSMLLCRSVMAFGWILAGVVGALPFAHKQHDGLGFIYGADGLSCGVRSIFPKAQFLFHLLPILISASVSAVLYSLNFLVLRGTLKLKDGVKLTLNPDERWTKEGMGENYHRFIARVARSMLWYPIAYIALLVPYSITRLLMISGFNVHFIFVVFAFVCWYFLGVLDVLLLYNTFRVLGPAFDARASAATRKDMESFGTPAKLEKYDPTSPSERDPELAEKIARYRNGSSIFSPPILQPSRDSFPNAGTRSPASSNNSLRGLLLPTHSRNATGSTLSTMSQTSISGPAVIGQPIVSPMPAYEEYNYVVTTPPPVASPSTRVQSPNEFTGIAISRDSVVVGSLPAPPRRRALDSPMYQQPSQATLSPVVSQFGQGNMTELARQRSHQTFGRRTPSNGSSYSTDSQISVSRQPSYAQRQQYGLRSAPPSRNASASVYRIRSLEAQQGPRQPRQPVRAPPSHPSTSRNGSMDSAFAFPAAIRNSNNFGGPRPF